MLGAAQVIVVLVIGRVDAGAIALTDRRRLLGYQMIAGKRRLFSALGSVCEDR
jgi:hypothetical protein